MINTIGTVDMSTHGIIDIVMADTSIHGIIDTIMTDTSIHGIVVPKIIIQCIIIGINNINDMSHLNEKK
jgi:hypothetical protein